jgi:hypothetical protein
MTEKDVMQIRVNGHLIGLVGLQGAMAEIARNRIGKTDETIQNTLIDRLSVKNYIPASAGKFYGPALLREFKKFLGEPVTDEPSAGLQILILGEGCPRCHEMERIVLELLSEMNLPAGVDHVTEPLEIAKYGVMGTPALVIGGRVVWVGSVPPKSRLKQWLEEAREESPAEKR